MLGNSAVYTVGTENKQCVVALCPHRSALECSSLRIVNPVPCQQAKGDYRVYFELNWAACFSPLLINLSVSRFSLAALEHCANCACCGGLFSLTQNTVLLFVVTVDSP